MKNKLKKLEMFDTPKSMKEMQDYLDTFEGADFVTANTAAFMMYNLMVEMINSQDGENN